MTSSPSSTPLQIPALRGVGNGRAIAVILLVSVLVFGFLSWLIYLKPAAGSTSKIIGALPATEAVFNSLSTVFLLLGFNAIRHRQFQKHMRFMLSALASSALFFVCYVVYHDARGDIHFLSHGLIRPIYFAILISHICLSAILVPLILTSFYLAFAGQYVLHRRVSRFTFPIWLYVSITGVLVFAMLKIFG